MTNDTQTQVKPEMNAGVGPQSKPKSMAQIKREEEAENKKILRKLCRPGTTVYTIMRHCSRSGMFRIIDCYVLKHNKPHWIGRRVAKAIGFGWDDRRQGIKVGGCGMDMGFHVVYSLSYTLYPKGFNCTGEGTNNTGKYKPQAKRSCPSNDHFNGDRNYQKHHHNSGGYAIRQEWI